ncbi:MAG: pimeloyl-ACP methyl ester esterase BioH, partial [Algicola sp.]|nr:pimeloyl-ACP methyl ester esterase BioH [Algicola sp.]
LPELERNFDVHCIDLPGFGFNNGVKLADYTLSALAEIIAPLCPQDSILAGWSLGGLIASNIALNYPKKVASLCLIASSPCFVTQPDWQGIEPAVLQQFSQDLTRDANKTIGRFLAIQSMGSESARKDAKLLKKAIFNRPSADIEALIGGLKILENSDLRSVLNTLKMPIKGIYGQRDTLVAKTSIVKLADSLANFEYLILNKASHAPFISHQQDFITSFELLHLPLALI